jgi:hypothetical protein
MTAAIAESPPDRKAASAAATRWASGGESFELKRCKAAYDGSASQVPAINMLSIL